MDEQVDLWSNPTLLKVIRIWILSICILIVAIPEGMPLAISLAMALSISSLKKSNILIKNLEAI
jgi:magnesium-transporting ATPase (P-type)